MYSFNNIPEEIYKNVINNVLENVNKEELKKYYFLVKNGESNSNLSTLTKVNFRDDLILDLNKDVKEDLGFGLVFNNDQILQKKIKKEKKENDLIQKLILSNDNISDKSMIEKLRIFLKWNDSQHIMKEKKLNFLHKYYSFYDDIFSENMYIYGEDYDFYLSKQLNNLIVLSLSKYSKIFFDILNDLKKYNCNDIKKIIKENVKIKYDQRIINADTSGKRKRKTIFISEQMVILQITYNDHIYKIKNKIKGLQFDLNENLTLNPYLLFTDTQKGWIIILKNNNNKLDNLISESDYKAQKKRLHTRV